MMEFYYVDVVKEGLVTVKLKSTLVASKKTKWLRLCRQSSSNHCRLEFYDDPSGPQQGPPLHLVPLFQGDRAMIYSKKSKCGVLVNFRDGSSNFKFSTQSLYDAEVWMQFINDTVGLKGSTISPLNSSLSTLSRPKTPLPATPDITAWPTLKKRHSAAFHVKVLPCPALPWRSSIQCRLDISASDLSLMTLNEPPELLVSWPIDSIVRFGQDQNCFIIDTDSHSSTGEARVKFVSFEAHEIYLKFEEVMFYILRVKTGH